jgi:hypothetical protein
MTPEEFVRRGQAAQAAVDALTGALDLDACPTRTPLRRACRCLPVCATCGDVPHLAVHGPIFGAPPGSKPWGHRYVPQVVERVPRGTVRRDR